MTMALSRAGQLLYLFWSNSKFFLHIDPDVEITTRRFVYGAHKLHCHWYKDVQLYSIYLDRVDQQSIECRSYKYQHEPLKRILNDFVEYVLLMKPDDIVCFAIEYFTAFSHSSYKKCDSQFKIPQEIFGEFMKEVEKEDTDEVFFVPDQQDYGEMSYGEEFY